MSGTNAQSPTAQTSGQSGTRKNWSTRIRPRSFPQESGRIRGLGTVPAVQTKVRDGIATPSTNNTLFSVMLLTRVLSRTSTPRRASTFCVYRPRLSPSSGRITETGMHEHNSQHIFTQIGIEGQRFPHEVI